MDTETATQASSAPVTDWIGIFAKVVKAAAEAFISAWEGQKK